jgi:hypothetical protein
MEKAADGLKYNQQILSSAKNAGCDGKTHARFPALLW